MADDMWFCIYLSLLPCYQRLVKGKRWFWSIGLFFYPSIAFLPNPDSDSDQHFVSRTSKRLFCVVFRALASGRTTSRLRRGILFEIYSLSGNCKMILAMILLMWCSSCCHCCGNTRVTYVFKRNHRMCWKEICTDSDSRGCVWKWWFAWISHQNGHQLVISGDNDKDDNSNGFWGFPNISGTKATQTEWVRHTRRSLWWPPWCRDILPLSKYCRFE